MARKMLSDEEWQEMYGRKMIEPVREEKDDAIGGYVETHPAFGMISVGRGSNGSSVLFDSEIKNRSTMTVTISTASRRRHLKHDSLFTEQRIMEVEMSEAQWASFVSSSGHSGVPCTIRSRESDPIVAEFPYAPRMQESLDEVRGAADEAMARVVAAFAAFKEKRSAANLRALESAINGVGSNMEFAAKQLVEHAEKTTEKMRADVEAMVMTAAERNGLPQAEALELMPPDDDLQE